MSSRSRSRSTYRVALAPPLPISEASRKKNYRPMDDLDIVKEFIGRHVDDLAVFRKFGFSYSCYIRSTTDILYAKENYVSQLASTLLAVAQRTNTFAVGSQLQGQLTVSGKSVVVDSI